MSLQPQHIIALTQTILQALDSSSSSEDEDDLHFIGSLINEVCDTETHVKIRGYVDEVVSQYSDADFKKHFRLNRSTCCTIASMFQQSDFCPPSHRIQGGGTAIFPAEDYMLVFLWFAGNKASYRDVADRFGISESKVFNIINTVMDFLVDKAPTYIYFPATTASKQTLAAEFSQLAGFSDVLGCLDGSYIETHKPVHKIRSTYINRHDGISITLQGICDAKKRFLDVFTGCPSKIHDSLVFKLSPIYNQLENICENTFHILADGAYELREWVLTPYRNYELLSRARQRYNDKFCSTRVVIENAFGILKKRFIQLLELFMWDVDRITKFIISCCVLHNICIDSNDDVPVDDDTEGNEDDRDDNDGIPRLDANLTARLLRQRGEIKRDAICAAMQ